MGVLITSLSSFEDYKSSIIVLSYKNILVKQMEHLYNLRSNFYSFGSVSKT